MDAVDLIYLIIAVIGCAVGIYGLIKGSTKTAGDSGEWRGTVNQNLIDIKNGVSSIGLQMARMDSKLDNHETRIVVVETKLGIKPKKGESE